MKTPEVPAFQDSPAEQFRVGDVTRFSHVELVMIDCGLTKRVRDMLKDPYAGLDQRPRDPLEIFSQRSPITLIDLEKTFEDFLKVRAETARRYKESYEKSNAKHEAMVKAAAEANAKGGKESVN